MNAYCHFSGFFLLLSTILGFATVFVSKPVEDKFEIKDKEMEVIINDEDSKDGKRKIGLELREKNEPPDLNLNAEKGGTIAENGFSDVQYLSGSKTNCYKDLKSDLNLIDEANKLLGVDNNDEFIDSNGVT